MKAVLDSIPGKSEYLRARIVGALLKLGATLWGDPESDPQSAQLKILLKSLLKNPGNDTDIIDTQAANITGIKVYFDAVYNQSSNSVCVQFLNEGMLDVIGDFPGTTSQQRIASVEVLRQTPIWGDDIIKLVLDYDNDVQTYRPILTGYLTGILGAIPTLKFRLNALKGGINGVLDSLPNINAQERDPIMLGIATSHAWSDEAFSIINALRTPFLPDEEDYITALKLKGIEENVPNMTGYTQFDQNNVIDAIISLNLWGEAYYDLNDLRQIAPGLIGETNVINALVNYVQQLDDQQLDDQQGVINDLNGISTITDTEERATAVANLE